MRASRATLLGAVVLATWCWRRQLLQCWRKAQLRVVRAALVAMSPKQEGVAAMLKLCRALPKVELHAHLGGSARISTIAELVRTRTRHNRNSRKPRAVASRCRHRRMLTKTFFRTASARSPTALLFLVCGCRDLWRTLVSRRVVPRRCCSQNHLNKCCAEACNARGKPTPTHHPPPTTHHDRR